MERQSGFGGVVRCSCGIEFEASPESYVGTQLFPGVALALFNCPAPCHSTRAVCLGEEEQDDEEPIAAE